MIALTSAIGKIYHLVLADRFDRYIKDNKLLDVELQKAFLKHINGTLDHTFVVSEIMRHARLSQKTVHLTWFDLKDAFGSVPHDLICHTLRRNNFPDEIVAYISNLYGSLQGEVVTPNWSSKFFQFKRGVFQGDPLSPLIFLLAFNPIIDYLKSEEKHGYILNKDSGVHHIVNPFADDFNLATRRKDTHQRILRNIDDVISKLSLTLKPSKCKPLSIVNGSFKPVAFKIGNSEIETLHNKNHKYLGALVTKLGKPSEVFSETSNILKQRLENIDSTLVRNKFKFAIYVTIA
jgi:hypothetical protein